MPPSIYPIDGKIAVSSPFNHAFPARARELGGTWDAGRCIWVFEAEAEERVRALCAEIYGPNGELVPVVPHYYGHRMRLRQRVMDTGAEGLPDYELLELLLFANDRRHDVKPLAKALIERFGGFAEVLAAPREALFAAGVTLAGAAALKGAREAALRLLRAPLREGAVLNSWDCLIDYCNAYIAHSQIEEFHVLFLDSRNVLLRHERQAGTVNHVPVYVREVIKRALEVGSTAMILVHNHPSGNPKPSDADIALTRLIASTAMPLGITLHDHIIIGRGAHYSLREHGLIAPPTR